MASDLRPSPPAPDCGHVEAMAHLLTPAAQRSQSRNRGRGIAGIVTVALLAGVMLPLAMSRSRSVAVTSFPPATDLTTDGARPADEVRAPSRSSRSFSPPTTDPGVYESVVWPSHLEILRYDRPEEAARAFVEWIGFDAPLVGFLRPTAEGTGEIAVRPTRDGPVTTVSLRQIGPDGSWWVLGSSASGLVIDTPVSRSLVSNPLYVHGIGQSPSGTVELELRGDRSTEPELRAHIVTGGGVEPITLEGQFGWAADNSIGGSLIVLSRDRPTGRIWEATVIRVRFPQRAE